MCPPTMAILNYSSFGQEGKSQCLTTPLPKPTPSPIILISIALPFIQMSKSEIQDLSQALPFSYSSYTKKNHQSGFIDCIQKKLKMKIVSSPLFPFHCLSSYCYHLLHPRKLKQLVVFATSNCSSAAKVIFKFESANY